MQTRAKANTLLGAVLSPFITPGSTPKPAALARMLTLGLALLATAPSQAAKSGGSTTPTGSIYYIGPWAEATNGGTAVMTAIKPDGSGKTELGRGLFGIPSRLLHNGHRWFVSTYVFTDQYYPDGVTRRREMFALRDDYHYSTNNNSNTRVQLTDDITLEPMVADWVPGDLHVSFSGRRWSSADPGAVVVEGGIYKASVAFGADGSVVGLAAPPATPAIPFPLVEPSPGDLRPDLSYYSWAPTGDMVTYLDHEALQGLWVADLLGARLRIYSAYAHMPEWSPKGDKIAFTSGGICTIKPDGTGVKRVIPNTSTWLYHHAKWSPDGNYLVFTGNPPPEDSSADLFRASASGGNLVQLTSTPAPYRETTYEFNGGWR